MIRIITDTTCVLPQRQMMDLEIPFLPQIIIFGNDSYRDDTEIDTVTFLQKLNSSTTLPKTAAPAPALYNPIYQKYSDLGEPMVVITPSAEVSGTYRSAMTAANDFPQAKIKVIDSLSIAGGLGQMVLQASEWAHQGIDFDDLVTRISRMIPRNRTYFVLGTLEYLYKGGRIGGAQALFGSILQVKPILTLRKGHIEPVESQRTKKRALARMKEIVLAECPKGQEARLSISQCDAIDEAKELAGYFTDRLGVADIPIYEAPPAIVVHGGPKIISISFYTSETP